MHPFPAHVETDRRREKERDAETQVMQSWVKESIYPSCGSSRPPRGMKLEHANI